MDRPLWAPSAERIAATRLTAFIRLVEERHSLSIADYAALYDFSIARPDDFWRLMWEFGGVRGTRGVENRRRFRPHARRQVLPRRHDQFRRRTC